LGGWKIDTVIPGSGSDEREHVVPRKDLEKSNEKNRGSTEIALVTGIFPFAS
jgi:hypothetical protein